MKKPITVLAALALLVLPTAGWAACFADYKAKKDDPLQLHYGIMELPDSICEDKRATERAVSERIGKDGWTLLTVMSVFGEEGLEKREESAGAYFLRY